MKKTILIALVLSLAIPCATAQKALSWERFNISTELALEPTEIQLHSGLFDQHPNRHLRLIASYRFKRHWEFAASLSWGCYLGYSGGISSHMQDIFFRDPEYGFSYGIFAEYHIIPFEKRQQTRLDGMLRLGFSPGQDDIDNVWLGLGISYRIAPQVYLLCSYNIGEFRYRRFHNSLVYPNMPINTGSCYMLGVKIEL